ncbi:MULTISPECIES: hypothetical protein [unclassified Fusobacterium]|uniref:hypothetical protein n=1 Tax=unclassified Fusobacterium TaxID=2648384 RepID=UPI001B8A9494|nr:MULTISPECIES: hypothetical protein [unclassified Fusobacterium]MBR8701454.1 hypothetical protein [Fusobacterium sp. DD45]MBR8711222.1 hypothetical protein [Fusobacterium sp. DD28]MBR8751785.1 hypothetical protein [Fusobacterium sp. DD26]
MNKCVVLEGHVVTLKNTNYNAGQEIELTREETARLLGCGCIKVLEEVESQEDIQQEIESDEDIQEEVELQEEVETQPETKKSKTRGKKE